MIGPMERDAPPHPANNVTPRWWGIGLDSCPYLVLVLNTPEMSMSMSMSVVCGDGGHDRPDRLLAASASGAIAHPSWVGTKHGA